MRIESFVRTLAAAAMLVVASADAQNLLSNPYFDEGLSDWEPFDRSRADWDRTMDVHNDEATRTASAELDSHTGVSFIAQCVPIEHQAYVGTVWIYSTCAGQTLDIFWADDGCIASADVASAQSTITGAWQQVTAVGTPTAGSSHAVVTLLNPASCASTAFFDVAVLRPDPIFANGFEWVP
jgi:hypothetical protein